MDNLIADYLVDEGDRLSSSGSDDSVVELDKYFEETENDHNYYF
jgi:hypothetical protein